MAKRRVAMQRWRAQKLGDDLAQKFGIGQPVARFEDPRLLRGEGRYLGDIDLPDQAYAVVLRSPHAHARITSIDTTTAGRRRPSLSQNRNEDRRAPTIARRPARRGPPALLITKSEYVSRSPAETAAISGF